MSHYPESHISTLSNALFRMPKEVIENVIIANDRITKMSEESANNCIMEEEDER